MTQQPVELFTMPENLFFALKDVVYTPTAPRMNEVFTVKGKVNLLGFLFLGPVWIIATVTYPEEWWEIIGAPTVSEGGFSIGGDFEIKFVSGFSREGIFALKVEVYAGPTFTVGAAGKEITLPPFPPVARVETTFIVAGEMPPQELNFRNFKIVSYAKDSGTPVTPPNVLSLAIGDRCRVKLGFEHTGPAVSGKIRCAIGNYGALGFDEVLFAEATLSVLASTDWKPYGATIDIIVTSAISGGTYDMYAKIMGITGGDVFTPYVTDVISIAGGVGAFSNLQIIGYTTPVKIGQTCQVTVTFDYQGPAVSALLYAAIGNDGVAGFDEVLKGQNSISIPETPTKKSYTNTVIISITSTISPAGSPYDVYAKINSFVPKIESPHLQNVITVTNGAQSIFSNLLIEGYDTAKPIGGTYWVICAFDYQGPALSVRIHVAIGNSGAFGFDEILAKEVTVNMPANVTPVRYWQNIGILITSAINPAGSPYDLYFKIDGIISPHLLDVVNITPTEQLVSITVQINADAAVMAFPGADRWMVYYWDPKASKFVGDGAWHYLSIWPGYQVGFENIAPGGYLSVFLWDMDTDAVSGQFTSPSWDAVNGGHYEYDPYMNRIYPF